MPTSSVDAGNQYQSYLKGWTAGAAVRASDPACTEHTDPLIRDAYNKGYADGRAARQHHLATAAFYYEYTPNILRLAETVVTEPS